MTPTMTIDGAPEQPAPEPTDAERDRLRGLLAEARETAKADYYKRTTGYAELLARIDAELAQGAQA